MAPDLNADQPARPRIPCAASASVIHLLGGVSGGGYPAAREQTVALIVRLHYVDGPDEDHKLLNGVHLSDIHGQTEVPQSKLAVKLGTCQLRYLTITPAQAGKMISFIELVKGNDSTMPVIAGITVERVER
jgi:hypothetical protein